MFTAREAANADAPLLACEGEINALALSLSPWAEPGRVVSVGPAGNMGVVTVGGRDVILFADDDAAGHKAALNGWTIFTQSIPPACRQSEDPRAFWPEVGKSENRQATSQISRLATIQQWRVQIRRRLAPLMRSRWT